LAAGLWLRLDLLLEDALGECVGDAISDAFRNPRPIVNDRSFRIQPLRS
jgi:hypothetical protein